MLTRIIASCLLINLSSQCVAAEDTSQFSDGQIRQFSDTTTSVWDDSSQTWVSIEEFWQNYAKRNGGVAWGKRKDYPPYGEVREFDTLLIELDSGICLMEFFHSRWRRANAVRRWDERYDEYSGCPDVFAK